MRFTLEVQGVKATLDLADPAVAQHAPPTPQANARQPRLLVSTSKAGPVDMIDGFEAMHRILVDVAAFLDETHGLELLPTHLKAGVYAALARVDRASDVGPAIGEVPQALRGGKP